MFIQLSNNIIINTDMITGMIVDDLSHIERGWHVRFANGGSMLVTLADYNKILEAIKKEGKFE